MNVNRFASQSQPQSGGHPAESPPRPARPRLIPEFIPVELKNLKQWVVWRYEWRENKTSKSKWTKSPYRGYATGKHASSTNSKTWDVFRSAWEKWELPCINPPDEVDGIGFVFSATDPYFGVDLDHCLTDGGEVLEWALPLVESLRGTYGEISPSGTGIKFWGRGSIAESAKREGLGPDGTGAIEIYDRGRYFTMTGNRWGDSPEIVELQEVAEELYAFAKARPGRKPKARANGRVHSAAGVGFVHGDEALLGKARQAKNGAKFSALFDRGDISGYPSQSQADQALMNMLAFWTACDAGRMEALFSRSALGQRDKWRERADDYRRWTIETAISGCTETYIPQAATRNGHTRETIPGVSSNGDGRVEIEILESEDVTVKKCLEALQTDPLIYQRGHMLVMILRDPSPAKGMGRPPGSPTIAPIPRARLREQLSTFPWKKMNKGRLLPARPDDTIVGQVFDRREYPGIRPIEGIVEVPILRPDGSIFDQPGYDEVTGMVFEPNMDFPPIPARPTHDDAIEAIGELRKLVQDFPFAKDERGDCGEHEAAWLSAALTPFARVTIQGPAPLFLNDASTPGSGKTLLADIISMMATGRPMARTTLPDNDEEIRKRITSLALAGDQMVLLDNVDQNTSLGSQSLDAALTGTTWKDRLLGRNDRVELPLNLIWYATGNNVALRGDIPRRVVPCRLEPDVSDPDKRNEFQIKEPLLEHVQKNRARLVVAALTVLRAYLINPERDLVRRSLVRFGSFEGWSDVVRAAVFWTTGKDPLKTQEGLKESSPESHAREALITGWFELPDSDKGLTTRHALDLVMSNPKLYATLRDALMDMSRNRELPGTRIVAKRLSSLRGRIIKTADGKLRVEAGYDAHSKLQTWRVVNV
jgi:primase-polymerase (primpol)-like protein